MTTGKKAIDIILSLLVLGATGSTTWCVKTILDHNRELAELKASQFTNKEALVVWSAINDLKINFARLPDQYPPAWFVERVNKLEKMLDRNWEELQAHTKKHP
jgi:hypothetical protein